MGLRKSYPKLQQLAFVLPLGLAALLVFFASEWLSGESGLKTSFAGGTYEASGVAHVPGTDGVLFVDDGRNDEIFWMRLTQGRMQAGKIEPVKLGVSVVDLEGITTDGSHFYVVGSQSKSKSSEAAGLVRFKFDAATRSAADIEVVSGLKRYLAENVSELRGLAETKYKDGGINIEGVAWDPNEQRLLLGLRSPIVDGNALVVPLRLVDPRGPLALTNVQVEGSRAICLPLSGAGIRSIEYDERSKAFFLISGAGPDNEKMEFRLWEWDGNTTSPTLREKGVYERKLKPEGITRVTSGEQGFTFIVFDTSGYHARD
jgi:hypothetical protein